MAIPFRYVWIRAAACCLGASFLAAAASAAQFQVIAKTGDVVNFGGTNATILSLKPPAGNTFGDMAFVAHVTGSGIDFDSNSFLIGRDRSGSQRLIARESGTATQAPAGSTFGEFGFGDVRVNDQGTVMFGNRMLTPSPNVNQYETIWTESNGLQLIDSGLNERFPGDHYFYHSTYLSVNGFNSAGSVLYSKFESSSNGSVITSGDTRFMIGKAQESPREIIREKTQIAFLGSETPFMKFSYLYEDPSLLDDGRVLYSAQMTGGGITSANNDMIWRDRNEIVLRDGAPAPGFSNGTLLYHINAMDADGSGQLAYRSLITGPGVDSTNEDAIFTNVGGTPRMAARQGQSVAGLPAGSKLKSFGYGLEIQGAFTTFHADFANETTPYGTGSFIEREGTLRALAYSGQPAPGSDGYQFRHQSAHLLPGTDRFITWGYTYNPSLQDGTGYGIWAEDANHQLQSVIHTGSIIDVGGEFKEVRNVFMNKPNSANQIPFSVEFYDGSDALLMWDGSLSPAVLAGDFDANGVVDSRDYVIWRNRGGTAAELSTWRSNFGSSIASSSGDFNGDGIINAADYVLWRNGLGTTRTPTEYDAWRSHFGRAPGSGVGEFAGNISTAVPESSSFILLTAAAIASLALLGRGQVTGATTPSCRG